MSARTKLAAVVSLGLVPAYEWLRSGSHPLTAATLSSVYPSLSQAQVAEYLRPLNRALRAAGIASPLRVAAFLAQVGVESGELRYWEEQNTGAEYEGRTDLGNTQQGDGVRYKGRGPIQLTGRDNYRAAGTALGLPLEEQPELASELRNGFQIAAWYWNSHNLSPLADDGTLSAFRAITQAVNGGQNGAARREQYWQTAKSVLLTTT